MTTTELRNKIKESELPNWFNSAEVNIVYAHIKFDIQLIGLSSIHKFLTQQINGWEKQESIPNEFEQSKRHFTNLRNRIDNFINSHQSQKNESNLESYWRQESNQLRGNSNYFVYDNPQTEFLMKIHNEKPNAFQGAYHFIIGSHRTNNKQEFIGAILAYEFETKDFTDLLNRRNKEKSSISKLRNDFREQLNETETQLTEHLTNSSNDYKNYVNKIDEFKVSKESLFNEWFENSKTGFSDFDSNSKAKISDLEKTYEELLRLKKPADYWKSRATTLKNEGWKAIYWLIGLLVFACITLYLLLWLTPEGMLLSFVKGNAQAIKWSIVYVTFISFLAFGIRALNKVAFSSFHLARDAEEREQLTYVYLALIKDKAVDEKDKNLIMQSLFSRADTGLLKDDSGPTMPNDFASKIIGK
ncbi:hypothetical protein SAMN05421766_1025 [Zobellia uliginosa]|uniref:DUF6161 domain-containing protein n=1 Tax=Zobellia uliginosa TaxID=143224 RepID=A0ABY1KQI7_9FLAO|nr:DUF6161 domain-containing protein [Zobellia uliginosa]SIS46383.1 hypothetical protein SAMN05421766_1025 [Zobellia uliginosa]